MQAFSTRADATTLPVQGLTAAQLPDWTAARHDALAGWLARNGFRAQCSKTLLYPGADGAPEGALLGLASASSASGDGNGGGTTGAQESAMREGVREANFWAWGAAAAQLPAGRYRVTPEPDAADAADICLAWGLGCYRFRQFKTWGGDATGADNSADATLIWPKRANRPAVTATLHALYQVRDLINMPAGDMGPAELAAAARTLAREYKAPCRTVIGDALLKRNFPMIHAVGRASSRAPRLIDFGWGDRRHPKLTLVGKGVCFDSGGLDLKPSRGMVLMKKDMGGAAQVLGLARMIMAARLPVRLRVLIPAVENSVSGNAFRPLDILKSRKGPTVEVGNTDAEGRLVLADALTLACEEKPALLLDFATLTGAARIALGTELPALFTPDDGLAAALEAGARTVCDPVWRMPLVAGYDESLSGAAADINSAPGGGYGGAITAALFLARFVDGDVPWAHFDLMAWNLRSRPGRPKGGEAQAIRGVFSMLQNRFTPGSG